MRHISASGSYNASVDILAYPATQSETTQLNFGRFAKPGSGKTATVDAQSADGATTIGGDATDQTQYGSVSVGVIEIGGDTIEDIDIAYAAANTAPNGLLLSELNCKYGSDAQTNATGTNDITLDNVDAPGAATDLKVAGQLTIDSDVTTGTSETFAYTIAITYD